MQYAHDPQDRFFRVMGHTFNVLVARGVADLPEFPLLGFDRGKDRAVVYLERLMRHCDHITRRCDEIVQLLGMMSTTHDKLQSLEAEFDRLASLVVSDDPAASHRAIQDYNRTLDSKIDMRAGLRGVLSEAITVKFASISYTLFPTKGKGRTRAEITRPMQALKREKALLGSGFAAENQRFLEHLEQRSKDESKAWQSLRGRRGEDLAALFEPLMTDLLPYLDRDARDQIVHFDERIDTNETRSEQISFADMTLADLTALRQQVAQLSADSKAVSAGIWRFRNRLPEA